MQAQPIEEIFQQFPDEYVAIEVLEMDEENTIPLRGHLIHHSPNKAEVDSKIPDSVKLYIVHYTGKLDEDIAVVI